jgi:hypothetical protein
MRGKRMCESCGILCRFLGSVATSVCNGVVVEEKDQYAVSMQPASSASLYKRVFAAGKRYGSITNWTAEGRLI